MNSIFQVLNIIVIAMIGVAALFLLFERLKSKKASSADNNTPVKNETKKNNDYQTEYVQDFMDFDKIYNDMIIRDKGTKFTMVVHCSGINFDLMSENERTMVEEAFIELLNFIRFPIQLYVQTRKVDLKDSLKTYGAKISSIESEIRVLVDEYNNLKVEAVVDKERMGMINYELQRKQNLYEYAVDLKNHIERMSVSSNVLQHRYYVAITYHIEELGMMTNFSEAEVLEMAYAELYTRCHSITNALMGCDIEAKILDSNNLAELLYMAFNRDDAEIYRLKDNMEAGFYRLYSTTEAVESLQQDMSSYLEDETQDQLLLLSDGVGLDEMSIQLLLESVEEKV